MTLAEPGYARIAVGSYFRPGAENAARAGQLTILMWVQLIGLHRVQQVQMRRTRTVQTQARGQKDLGPE